MQNIIQIFFSTDFDLDMFWWDSPKIMCWIKAQKTLNVHVMHLHKWSWDVQTSWRTMWEATVNLYLTDIATRLEMYRTFVHLGIQRENGSNANTTASVSWKTGHFSIWLRVDLNRGSRVRHIQVSFYEHPKRSHFGPWDLKIKALRDTVPFTRKFCRTINHPIIQ